MDSPDTKDFNLTTRDWKYQIHQQKLSVFMKNLIQFHVLFFVVKLFKVRSSDAMR